MKRLSLLVLAIVVVGCATQTTYRSWEQLDATGTVVSRSEFKGKTNALFSKTSDTNQNLSESVNEDGSYTTAIGQAAASMDSSEAVSILNTVTQMMEALERAYTAKVTAPVVPESHPVVEGLQALGEITNTPTTGTK